MAPGPPIRVLIGDGDTRVRQLVRWLLEEDGRFDVVAEARTGDEALQFAAEADVVVLDVAMPVVDGLTALATILEASPTKKVVIYSAHAQPYLRSEAARRGAAAFVDKSDEPVVLLEALAAAAGDRGVRR